MEIGDLIGHITAPGPAGVIALLAIIIWTGKQRWWVFGWYVEELHKRIERLESRAEAWKELALDNSKLADRASKAALRSKED